MTSDEKNLVARLRCVNSEHDDVLQVHDACHEAAARIEALTAERDAAVAQANTLADHYTQPFKDGITEGERRATAAIVADLRGMEWEKPVPLEIATRLIADHIEQKFGKPAP